MTRVVHQRSDDTPEREQRLVDHSRLLRAHLLRPGPPDALAPCEIHEVQLPDAHDVTWVAKKDAG